MRDSQSEVTRCAKGRWKSIDIGQLIGTTLQWQTHSIGSCSSSPLRLTLRTLVCDTSSKPERPCTTSVARSNMTPDCVLKMQGTAANTSVVHGYAQRHSRLVHATVSLWYPLQVALICWIIGCDRQCRNPRGNAFRRHTQIELPSILVGHCRPCTTSLNGTHIRCELIGWCIPASPCGATSRHVLAF